MTVQRLCPAQQAAYAQLKAALPVGNVFVVHGGTGRGKTTLGRALAHRLKSKFFLIEILYAYDRSRNAFMKPVTDYFLEAIQTVRTNKEQYAVAEARARRQHPARPGWFDVMNSMAMIHSMDEVEE